MARFVPIADLDAYISGLRREGFYTDAQIEEIREKHLLATKPEPPPYVLPPNLRVYKPIVRGNDVYLKWKVSGGAVRIKIVAPFDDYYTWIEKHGPREIPPNLYIKGCAMNGASREYCESLLSIAKRKFF